MHHVEKNQVALAVLDGQFEASQATRLTRMSLRASDRLYGGRQFDSFLKLQCRSKGDISGGARERRRREPLGGVWGHAPPKILKSRGLEMLFPAFSKSYF